MPRETFQHELDRLVGEVVDLGREVESSMDTLVEALERHDAEIARRELGVDQRFKERGAELDEECMILQARQASMAWDLRLINTAQGVANHLVRAGTLCEHICRAITETLDTDRDSDLQAALTEMSGAARDLFRQGLEVFADRDIEHARDLEAADDRVDLLYSEAMNLAVNPANKEKAGSSGWRVRAVLTVHYLERIADQGVDIGERTVFLVTGERMECAMLQYRNHRLNQDED